jgi:hypothetical protein
VLQDHGLYEIQPEEACTRLGYMSVLGQRKLLQHRRASVWELDALLADIEQVVPRGSRVEVAEPEYNTRTQPDV